MNRFQASIALLALALLATPTAMACGEGSFNMGQGLRYQTDLAPRPAVVLIYADPATSQQPALYRGLQKAGHKPTLANDTDALDVQAGTAIAAVACGRTQRTQCTAAAPVLQAVPARQPRPVPQGLQPAGAGAVT